MRAADAAAIDIGLQIFPDLDGLLGFSLYATCVLILVALVLLTTTGVVMLMMAIRRGEVRSPMWKRRT